MSKTKPGNKKIPTKKRVSRKIRKRSRPEYPAASTNQEEWRLLPLSTHTASINMGIDEAILESVMKNESPPTVRFYRWFPSTVSIGYFQSYNDEINPETCKADNIDVVRRITGGGAVYHSFEGEITYSIIVPVEHRSIPMDVTESYEKICNCIISGLKKLKISAEFKPINDIMYNGKKISGQAQTRKKGIFLQHGTLLMDLNVKEMFSYLNVSKEKMSDKAVKSVYKVVTSLKHEIEKRPDFNTVARYLQAGFEETLNIKLSEGNLSDIEIKRSRELARIKFGKKEWVEKR